MFLVASGFVEGLPFFGGVDAQILDQPSASPTEEGATFAPTSVDEAPPPSGTVIPPPLVTILKKAFPIQFELVLDVQEAADLEKVSEDVDGLLELYLLENLSTIIEDEDVDVRAVELDFTRLRRNLRLSIHSRRSLQDKDVSFLVDGNIIYDIDFSGCIECVDQKIDSELSNLLEVENLNSEIQSAELEGVNAVSSILPTSQDTSGGQEDDVGKEDDTGNSVNGVSSPPDDELKPPSTVSIILGFTLTGLAALSLLFYLYTFFRKRQKKLRKKRQQQQSIEYSMPAAAVPPSKVGQGTRRVSPVAPTSASTPAKDEDSDASSFKGVDSVSSEGEPADPFARELQMAASLDQQAWEDLQRQKSALDQDSSLADMKQPAEPVTRNAKTPAAVVSKSFPYGDETTTTQENGVEWTMNDASQAVAIAGWGPFNSDVSGREEKKEEWGSPRSSDPEPSTLISEETSAMMQSIERTLSQYGDSMDYAPEDTSMAPDQVVDEVNRLSRFVKRYERRKERHHQREIDQFNRSRSNTGTSFESPPPANDTSGDQSSFSPGINDSFRKAESMPASQARQFTKKPDFEPSRGDDQPSTTSYRGITMTGDIYGDRDDKRMFALSDSEDDDDTYRDDDGSLPSLRLGITPFKAQPVEDTLYSSPQSSPLEGHERSAFAPPMASMEAPQRTPDESRRQAAKSEGDFRKNQVTKLADLRKSEAVIDGTQSDVNVGFFPMTSAASPDPIFMSTDDKSKPRQSLFGRKSKQVSDEQTRSDSKPEEPKAGFQQKTTPSPMKVKDTDNPKFNKLRNIFEEKPKNAIFPPGENWQSGVFQDL